MNFLLELLFLFIYIGASSSFFVKNSFKKFKMMNSKPGCENYPQPPYDVPPPEIGGFDDDYGVDLSDGVTTFNGLLSNDHIPFNSNPNLLHDNNGLRIRRGYGGYGNPEPMYLIRYGRGYGYPVMYRYSRVYGWYPVRPRYPISNPVYPRFRW